MTIEWFYYSNLKMNSIDTIDLYDLDHCRNDWQNIQVEIIIITYRLFFEKQLKLLSYLIKLKRRILKKEYQNWKKKRQKKILSYPKYAHISIHWIRN